MDYKEKYLKYKYKYLDLKAQQDGSGLQNLRTNTHTKTIKKTLGIMKTSNHVTETKKIILRNETLLSPDYRFVNIGENISINFRLNEPLFFSFLQSGLHPDLDQYCQQINTRLLALDVFPVIELPALCLLSLFAPIHQTINDKALRTLSQFTGIVINDFLNIPVAGTNQIKFNKYVIQARTQPNILFILSIRGNQGINIPVLPNNCIVINCMQLNEGDGAIDDFIFWLLALAFYHAKQNKRINNLILWSGDKQKLYDSRNGVIKNLQTELYSQGPINYYNVNGRPDITSLGLLETIRRLIIIAQRTTARGAPDISVYRPPIGLSTEIKKVYVNGTSIKNKCYHGQYGNIYDLMETNDVDLHIINPMHCPLFFEQFIAHVNQIQYNEVFERVEGAILPIIPKEEHLAAEAVYNPLDASQEASNLARQGQIKIIPTSAMDWSK
jgi:hypothetical protein